MKAKKTAEGRGYVCPKCQRRQYCVCSNRSCSCWAAVPTGKKPQRSLRGLDVLACPYCGFKAHIDYWFDRSMRAVA